MILIIPKIAKGQFDVISSQCFKSEIFQWSESFLLLDRKIFRILEPNISFLLEQSVLRLFRPPNFIDCFIHEFRNMELIKGY